MAADSAGNVFMMNGNEVGSNFAVRRLDAITGALTLVAGNGTGGGFSGDGGPATSAQLGHWRGGIAVDSAGNIYIADPENLRVRRVSKGVITTVAGGGTSIGENVPATSAKLKFPNDVAVDAAGNLYIKDFNNVRKVSNGVITTVAGNGTEGFSGDNGPAINAQLSVKGIAVDALGNLYITETFCVRRVSNGVIATVAGNGTVGFSEDNGPATKAQVSYNPEIAVDASGNLYLADGSRIRKVSNGVITTVAGGGMSFLADNGPATSAQWYPHGFAVDSAGNLYLYGFSNGRLCRVSKGVITTVAGNGMDSFSGDKGPAASAQLYNPRGVAVDTAGNLFIADFGNNRVRKVERHHHNRCGKRDTTWLQR